MGSARSLALVAAVAISSTCLAAGAYDPHASAHRDNSGRQIAVVLPGMPHPSVAMPVLPKTTVYPISHPISAPVSAGIGSTEDDQRALTSRTTRLSSVGTPIKLSPEAQQALASGLKAAHGMSEIALKRASDFGTWLSVLWRELNQVPQATPAEPVLTPRLSVREMQPIQPAARTSQLFYTSEQRLRTVVAR